MNIRSLKFWVAVSLLVSSVTMAAILVVGLLFVDANTADTSTSVASTIPPTSSANEASPSGEAQSTPTVLPCGVGGSCTLADVAQHTTADDCWVVVAYTAAGGNGTGAVYKLAPSFFGASGTHDGFTGAPVLRPEEVCGRNISAVFNRKHVGGSLTNNGTSAATWLSANGNALIGAWSGQ